MRRIRSQPYSAHTTNQIETAALTVRHDDEDRRLSITPCIESTREAGNPS